MAEVMETGRRAFVSDVEHVKAVLDGGGTPDLHALAATAEDALWLRDALLYVAVDPAFSHDDIVEVVCRPRGEKGLCIGRETVRRVFDDGPADRARALRMADAFAAEAEAMPEAHDLTGAAAWLLWAAGRGGDAADMARRAPSSTLARMVMGFGPHVRAGRM